MIRIAKSKEIPTSLISTRKYNGEDVKEQLLKDQHGKCYICERKLETDFEIEHLRAQSLHPELRQSWANLHLSCGYCNKKKSGDFNNILNPTVVKSKRR